MIQIIDVDCAESHIRMELDQVAAVSTGPSQDADLAAIAGSIRAGLRAMSKNVFLLGWDLLRAKEMMGHGRFQPWLAAEFRWTARTAQNFMNVAARLGDKYESLSHLGAETLYKLAAPSTSDEVVETVTAMARAGDKVTFALVGGMLRRNRPSKSDARRTQCISPNQRLRCREEANTAASDPEMTKQASALLIAKFEPERLKRIAYLLPRCDVGELIAILNAHVDQVRKRDGL